MFTLRITAVDWVSNEGSCQMTRWDAELTNQKTRQIVFDVEEAYSGRTRP